MNALQAALKILADCPHPDDRRQYAQGLAGSYVRCTDCGAVADATAQAPWTRPALVARVIEVVQ